MTTTELTSSLILATPELILATAAMVLLMVGVFSGRRANDTVTGLAVAVLIGAGGWVLFLSADGQAFGGAFVNDPFARLFKVLVLIGSVVTRTRSWVSSSIHGCSSAAGSLVVVTDTRCTAPWVAVVADPDPGAFHPGDVEVR